MNAGPVAVEGLIGIDKNADSTVMYDAIGRWAAQGTISQAIGDEAARLMAVSDVVGRYNTLRPRLVEEQAAREERDSLRQLIETRWEAMSSAVNWLAAHHAYIVAVADARRAVDTWERCATAAAEIDFTIRSAAEQGAYKQILAAGHPPIEPLDCDVRAAAAQLRANLDQAHAHRRRVTAETLAVAVQSAATRPA
ncbi:hypothetical protein ABT095_25630 [Kitasatospora sp. NPDC002227]|uniref:hypothetical protein n=1 Tax=Kitasatospora sp. NPDC002227 TaxID=3154773 RepID=UPI0033344289